VSKKHKALLAEWQERLGLQDWRIMLKPKCKPEEMAQEGSGCVDWCESIKTARIFKIYGDDVFLDDLVFDDSTPEVTKPQCAKKIVDNKVSVAIFESNSAGEYYGRDVEAMVKELGGKCSMRLKRTITNKQTRIEYASDGIKAHFYFKDKSLYERNSQYGLFMREMLTYTRSGKVPHDDSVDMLSLAENEIRNLSVTPVKVIARPF